MLEPVRTEPVELRIFTIVKMRIESAGQLHARVELLAHIRSETLLAERKTRLNEPDIRAAAERVLDNLLTVKHKWLAFLTIEM